MGCDELRDKDGHWLGYACSRGRTKACSVCKVRPATKLCDWPLTGSKSGQTCDRDLCDRCAAHVGKDLDYCPCHAEIAKKAANP